MPAFLVVFELIPTRTARGKKQHIARLKVLARFLHGICNCVALDGAISSGDRMSGLAYAIEATQRLTQ